MKRIAYLLAVLAFVVTACDTDADIASRNVSKAADQFEVQRRVVFINGITDQYLLTIEGLCSIEADNLVSFGAAVQLEVTCKRGENDFVKHFLGLSDNVTYMVEQLVGIDVSTQRYRVVFKPEAIVPNVDVEP